MLPLEGKLVQASICKCDCCTALYLVCPAFHFQQLLLQLAGLITLTTTPQELLPTQLQHLHKTTYAQTHEGKKCGDSP